MDHVCYVLLASSSVSRQALLDDTTAWCDVLNNMYSLIILYSSVTCSSMVLLYIYSNASVKLGGSIEYLYSCLLGSCNAPPGRERIIIPRKTTDPVPIIHLSASALRAAMIRYA